MSKRIVIVSGGKLEEKVCLPLLEGQEEGYVIGVDKGVEFLYNHQIMPDYIVGDFDSVKQEIVDYYRNETHVGIREFNPVKDASDTEIAIRLAMTLGGTDLVILGATGGRIDHLWANVQCLTIPFKAGVHAEILDSQKPDHPHWRRRDTSEKDRGIRPVFLRISTGRRGLWIQYGRCEISAGEPCADTV